MPCSLVDRMTSSQDFNVFVGAETGLFKGVHFNNQQIIAKNLNSLQSLDRQQEITCLAWGNEEENEILIGLRNQKVKIYDTEFKGFSGCVETPAGTGPLRGVGKCNGSIITASESGYVKLWKFKASEQVEFHTINDGEKLSCMRLSPFTKNIVATGGKKSELQLWDLENSQKPVFKGKNLRNDFLDLPIPIWVSDLAFVPNSEQVVTCSRHGYVRLYDPRSRGRRPVVNCIPETGQTWSSITVASRPNQVIVGSGKGRMLLVDFRKQKPVHAYRGFSGGIRQIIGHPTEPLVVSVGLDRFVRVHHLDKQAPLYKSYLKSRLNALLMRRDFCLPEEHDSLESPRKKVVGKNVVVEEVHDDADMWNNMEVIKESADKENEDQIDEEDSSEDQLNKEEKIEDKVDKEEKNEYQVDKEEKTEETSPSKTRGSRKKRKPVPH